MTILSDWMMSHPSVFFSKLKVWLIARILMSVNTTSLEFATMLVQKGELFRLRSETDPPCSPTVANKIGRLTVLLV